jgi:hypothetical protein
MKETETLVSKTRLGCTRKTLAILTAVILFGFSFTFSSCKDCGGDKNKGKDNPNNPDNPVDVDGDKNNPDNVSVLDNPDLDEAKMAAKREAAQLAELDEKIRSLENEMNRLVKNVSEARLISSRALNDENLFYDAIAAGEAADVAYQASRKVFIALIDIHVAIFENPETRYNSKINKRSKDALDAAQRAMDRVTNDILATSKNVIDVIGKRPSP